MGVAEAPRTWWTKTARIKEKFPNPVKNGGGVTGTYCVGGAFMRFYHLDGGFPPNDKLAGALKKVNNNLDWSRATRYASQIIYANDQGDFCGAWDALEEALTF